MTGRVYKIVITGIFLLLLLLPSLQQITGVIPEFRLVENRRIAPRPDFTWDSLASGIFQYQFDAYMNDNYGLRSWLVMLNNQINVTIFKVTR